MRNKYAGKCLLCGKHVPPDFGHFERHMGRWYVRCSQCVGTGVPHHLVYVPKKQLDKIKKIDKGNNQ